MAPSAAENPKSPIQMEGITGRAKRGPDQHGHYYWTARVTDDAGTRTETTLGWMTRADAVREVARMLADGLKPKPAPAVRAEIETVGDLLAKWLGLQERREAAGEIRPATLHVYRNACSWGLGYLGDVQATAMTSDLLMDTLLELRAGLAPRTVQMIGRVIVMAHEWALERGHIAAGRPLKLRMSSATVRPKVTPDMADIERVLGKLKGWRHAYVSTLAATGARPGEIAILRREHVELLSTGWGILHIPDEPGAKTGARDVPLQPWAVVALRPMLDREPDERLFPPNARERANASVRKLGSTWSLYGLRRAAATALASTPGVTPGALAAIMGHSGAVSAAIYQRRDIPTLMSAMKAAAVGSTRRGEVAHLAVVGDNSRGQVPDLPDED